MSYVKLLKRRADEYKLVGQYVQIERQYAWQAHVNELARLEGYIDPDDDDIEAEQDMKEWLDANRDKLPDWFTPGYIEQIESHLSDLFTDVTGRLNHEIEQYRFAFDDTEKQQHRTVQMAYEYCRKRLYHLIKPLSRRQPIEPPKPKVEQPHPLECQCDECVKRGW